MKELSGCEERVVRIKSTDPSIPEKAFVIELTSEGLAIRRLGAVGRRRLSWKAIIGLALIHCDKDDL